MLLFDRSVAKLGYSKCIKHLIPCVLKGNRSWRRLEKTAYHGVVNAPQFLLRKEYATWAKKDKIGGHRRTYYHRVHRVLAEGNFVLCVSQGNYDSIPSAFYDLFRLDSFKIVEHWDTNEKITPRSEWKNDNGKFWPKVASYSRHSESPPYSHNPPRNYPAKKNMPRTQWKRGAFLCFL